jgi:hypothetical protein
MITVSKLQKMGIIWIIWHEANGHFRNKESEYLGDKINEFARNSKNKNIKDLYRGIN